MRNIRKLYFQNSRGERWGLNGDRGVYASNLSGFGLTLSPNFADLGRGFFAPVSDEAEPQNPLAFTLTFTLNPYETYDQLVGWLASAGTITVVYDPSGKKEYWRDVAISFLQKGELTQVGWLEAPASFQPCTPWYLPAPTKLVLEGTGTDDSKRYDYVYDEDLRYGEDSAASISASIAGGGHVPGALELSFYGAIVNPRIRLTGNVSGKTFGVCSISAVMAESDRLLYSSRRNDSYVKKVTASGIETDLLDALDLSTNPFFHLPVNEPCTITFEADGSFAGVVDLTIYYYYRSV